ncbi:MAG TPA: glycosyltransferase family 4 protein [Fibrobacteria bacterium]|nr:glycosyltransferase family 4 protein [Fibrobacteria bacterium]
MKRNRLLLILPGPLWEIKDSLRQRMERLSERYQGRIVTTMPESGGHRLGNFTLTALRYRRGAPWKPWMNLKFLLYGCLLGLRARLGGESYDLVVAYDPLRSGLIGLLVARLAGARFAPEVNGVYESYANYLDGGPRWLLACKRHLYPRLVGFTLSRADGIKTLFPSQLKHYRDRIRTPVVEHFFDYVDLEPFRDLGEEKVVLFVGFPYKLKGVDLLIEAFKRVAPRHPGWKLKILGWFPDLRELDAAIGGHPDIFRHPPVFSRDMPGHMGRCGIFVLPSRTEAMGRVLLEAMACAKPRVGADVEGIPTVIEDGVDGLLFQAGNADDLAAKLDLLMGDAALRKSLGMAGRMRSIGEFNANHYFRRLLDFYGRVLRQIPTRRSSALAEAKGAYDAV